nr:hypothetical protein [Tanacetum cinerariifolium]
MLTNITLQKQSPSGSRSLLSNTIANPRGDFKAITTRSGVAYDGPTIPLTPSPLPKEVECETEATKDKKLSLSDLTPTRMTLELATRSFAYPAGIAEDVFMQVGKFTFLADFVIVDYDADPRVPLILGRLFLRTARALIDVHKEELILRDGDEKLIFHADSTPKHTHKHGNESINMINFIDITCEDLFPEVLKFKKLNHPSSEKPSLDYSPPPGDDDDDDLFDLNSNDDEWKKRLYGDYYKEIDSKKYENKDSKRKLLVVEAHIDESNNLLTQLLTSDSTLPEESSEIATLSSSPFGSEDK